jgi:hypothetical protein
MTSLMRHAFALTVLVLFLTADLPLPAQLPGPGEPGGCLPGYPCGTNSGGPGIPLPGRHKKKNDAQEPLQTLRDTMLRQLDENNIVVESKDTRLIHMKRLPGTKFLRDGDPMKASILKPGDHLIIDYREDDEGFMTAVSVTLEQEGTPSERERASAPVEIVEPVSQHPSEDERPVQRRRDSKKADSSRSGAPPAQHADSAQAPAAQPATAAGEPPPIVPPDAGLDLEHIPANTSSRAAMDDSDSGPPKLSRGKPKPRKTTEADQVALNSPRPPEAPPAPAAAEPTAPASEPLPAAPRPSLSGAAEGPSFGEIAPPVDAHIQKAREAADAFTESLPDYVCQQQTARFQSTTHVVSWVPLDIVSAELVYEKGRESYRNLAINGKPAKAKRMEEIPGSISTGEFGSTLADLFSPVTAADFRFRRNSKSGGRTALLYDFQVDHEHSHWAIHAPSQAVLPAYRGSVWIDKETGRTLRIEMQTVHLPEEFPFDKIEMATDYEFIRLAEHQFLLPVHSENLMCQRGTSVCAHNVIDFRNYHKFTGESTIEFGK